jgi:hypothetical protein
MPTSRSQIAFMWGAWTALRGILVPAVWKTASKDAVKFDPQSRIRASPCPHRGAGGSLALLAGAEQGAGVLVEDGPGGVRVDLGVVDVIDGTQEGVPVFVGEVGSEDEPVRTE